MLRDYESIPSLVRELEREYTSGIGVQMSEYVREDLYTDINTIYAYLNSKHISGEYDSFGREKPFFNIVIAARNIWFRATDIDRKHINLTPSRMKDAIGTFLLNLHLHQWMREEKYGMFLNKLGLEGAGFNSAVAKHVEKDGRLIPSVIPWSRLIVDQIDFYNNPKVEVLELTEAQLYERGYDKGAVKALCESAKARETLKKEKKDNKNNYYKVYEVHGKFPLSLITGDEADKDIFRQQMHVISFVDKKKRGGGEKYDEFTLFKGLEEKDPYYLVSLLPNTDGSISLNGAVKNLFEAQWMTNHSVKAIKDQLDLASKLIFQTADSTFVGQNVLKAIETGDILIHSANAPLTQLQNNSHDISALQSFGGQWKQLSAEINGISEAMLGQAPKSGTAWRQTEALLQESHSLFEIMTENKGLDISEMLRIFILPYLMKKMNNDKEVVATLDLHGIEQIEERFIKNKAEKLRQNIIKEQVLGGSIAQEPNMEELEGTIREGLASQGDRRFFKPSQKKNWKDEFKDLQYTVEIDITGEAKDRNAIVTTLNSALVAVTNPNFANNPKAQFIVNKILLATGQVSPMELSAIPDPQPINETLGKPNGGEVGAEGALETLQAVNQ